MVGLHVLRGIGIAVVWWILYPSWPWASGYLPGLLGYNQRVDLERADGRGAAAQAQWTDRIAAADAAAILADPELRQFALAGGEAAFKTNCAPCHGLGGAGQGFFPTLADDDWIWGGVLDAIEYHDPSRHPKRHRPGRARQRHAGLRR